MQYTCGAMTFASLPLSTALRLILPFGFGFFLSMFTRTLSNMVKQPIQLELGLGEEAISLALGTAFFVAFGLMQLPVRILVDRYDPRQIQYPLVRGQGTASLRAHSRPW